MAKRFKAISKKREMIFEIDDAIEDIRQAVEMAVWDGVNLLKSGLLMSEQQAYKAIKKLLTEMGKYGF